MFGRRKHTAFLTAALLALGANYAAAEEIEADEQEQDQGQDSETTEPTEVSDESDDQDSETTEPTEVSDESDDLEESDMDDDDLHETIDIEESVAAPDGDVGTLRFAFDSDALSTPSKEQLSELISWMADNPERVIEIRGYTDDIGPGEYNMELGMRRAESARAFLVAEGIEADKIRVVSKGDADQSEPGSAANRRVLICTDEEMTTGDTQHMQGDGDMDAPPATGPLAPQDEPLAVVPVQEAPERQWSLALGGGVLDYTDSDTDNFTSTGGTWDVGVAYGANQYFGIEANYIGAANSIDALGLDSSAVLVSTMFEADIRWNILKSNAFQPYILGGIGWSHYEVANDDFNTSSVKNSDDAGHFPVGAGVAYRASGFRIDARLTQRWTFNDNLINTDRADDNTTTDMHNFAASLKLGYEF